MDTEKLIESGFEELNNGYWIFKGCDPNQAIWFTIEAGLSYIANRDKNAIIARINDTNQVDNVHEAIEFLTQRYAVSTTNEAKCIKMVINKLKERM
jgi:hypothetical protein